MRSLRFSPAPAPLPLLLVFLGGLVVVNGQFDDGFGSPAPPRFSVPGAVPLGPAPGRRPLPRIQARRQQLSQPEEPQPRVRTRPPNGRAGRLPLAPVPSPTPAPQFFAPPPPVIQQRPAPLEDSLAPRPVIEEPEDDYEEDVPAPGSFSPAPAPSTPPPPPPPPPQRPLVAFRPDRPPVFRPERPAVLPTPAPELNFVSPTRQQLRPTAFSEVEEKPRKSQYNRVDTAFTSRNKVRPTPAPEEQQFTRQSQSQAQYTRAQNTVRAPQKPVYTTSAKQQDFEKPLRQHQRPRKPVAQVLRRYREDNADGSITWGFENDDGSFKEETIGTDCVTYGKYGYIDPDGNRREYTYSTGIPCDKEKDSQDVASEGYIDYAENKYILPNGDSIDLDKMVKNRARKPIQNTQYRN